MSRPKNLAVGDHPTLPSDWFDPLVRAYRQWGHLEAKVDPLDRDALVPHPDVADLSEGIDEETRARLRATYCGSIGVEFMHISDREKALWIAARMEDPAPAPVDRSRILGRLLEAETFEQFLHRRYIGSKRYSLEGAVGLITLLDSIFDTGIVEGVEVALLGMSHRGRLTVMVNSVGVPAEALFAGLEDLDPRSVLGGGDVKYHLGATGVHRRAEGGELRVHLASNPSHLEAVDPVLAGRVKARQTRRGENGEKQVLPVCVHGDAAFAGQGITSETLNLSQLEGYRVGGTIHVIVNNRIGFTAESQQLHSSRHASDAAKRIEVPILHVNGEDPQALERAGRIAVAYRQRFSSDVILDVVGFRRHGHSEVEDPTTTSPTLYEKIQARESLHLQLAKEWSFDLDELESQRKRIEDSLHEAQERGKSSERRPKLATLPAYWDPYSGGPRDPDPELETGVQAESLERIAAALTACPEGFNLHPKVAKMMEQRAAMLRGEQDLDFGAAESAAFGSLLEAGLLVRVTGQDSRRGTFNHRNAAWIDTQDGRSHVPLAALARDGARLEIHDSPLTEAAVLGFEYGFSRDYPDALVCWEAQFGDFANGAQVIIDQFIAAAEDKWSLLSGLVLLLPHGYEGQGPEHSSARIERFLQLASEHNLQICQPTTAAQTFHLLRKQALGRWRKPLVVFTPKGMLRAKAAASPREQILGGRFQRVLRPADLSRVERLLVASGKIVHELEAERLRRGTDAVGIVSLEQLYPLPKTELRQCLEEATRAKEIVWVQEEAANMGALQTVRPELNQLAGGRHVRTVKRSASASPATGSTKAHRLEQEALIRLAFA